MKYSLINYNNELNHWGAGWSAVRGNVFTAGFKQANRNSSWFCQMDLQQVRGSRMEITMRYEVKKVSRECGRRTEKLMNLHFERAGLLMDERDSSFLMMLLREEDHGAQGRFHRCRLFSDCRFLLRQKVPNLSCRARMCSNHVYWKNFGVCWMLSL